MEDTTRRNIEELLDAVEAVYRAHDAYNEDHSNFDKRLALSAEIGSLHARADILKISLKYDRELAEVARG